ncbi:MAG: SpoIIE family protein phosphatase [bacterium]|nr:MAG: SpoIIE family protein phosphatase [bacterium]
MPTYKFKSYIHLREFWNRLQSAEFYSFSQLFYFAGWIITFSFLCISLKTGFGNYTPILLILAFFWHRFNKSWSEKLKVPQEAWILLFTLLWILDSVWLSFFLKFDTINLFKDSEPTIFPTVLQIILLSFLTLTLSFILTRREGRRWLSYLFFMFLLIIGFKVLSFSDPILWNIGQILLVLVLLRYTGWTESLTKAENWLYFIVSLILFLGIYTPPDIYNTVISQSTVSWYYFPKILSHFFKLYLLAVLLKIPFVLVYHHASLKRKLQIAGWLQSSIPQITQLIILTLVFYFFISSWQANKLKNTLTEFLEDYTFRKPGIGQSLYIFQPDSIAKIHNVPNFASFVIPPSPPDFGILQLPTESDLDSSSYSYVLLYKSDQDSSIYYHLIEIDTLFLNNLNQRLSHFLSNGLLAYPFTLQTWDSNLYKIRIWERERKYWSLNTFPFALVPRKSQQFQMRKLTAIAPNLDRQSSSSRIIVFGQDVYTAGRIYAPLYTQDFQKRGYYAIDMAVFLSWDFFKSNLMIIFYFWLLIYFLVNLLIIQRVVKFGNQITQKIIQKFDQLTQGIRQVSEGNLEYKIEMEGEDEFVELADRFNRMGNQLQLNIASLRDKDRLEHELRIAREVQLGLLPKTLPKIKGYQVAAHINTATEVGGDFYDLISLSPEKYLIVVGDVSGKGTSAAFYMAQCISLIRFACQFSDKPQEIILRLNRYFSDPLIDRQIFVTIIMGILDTRKNQIMLLRAGHNHPILIPNQNDLAVKEIITPGIGIGLERKGQVFEKILKSKTVRLGKGDGLFLYTDGLVEASAYSDTKMTDPEKVTFFGEENLIDILNKSRQKNAQEMIQTINTNIRKFYGQSPLIDDLTMLLIRRNKE